MSSVGRRAGLLVAGVLGLSSLAATSGVAQPSGPPTATLLKRLAEAVDGHRTGGTVFLVADLRPPHDVLAIFDSLEPARARVGTDPNLGAFGPYLTERDPGAMLGWFSKCVHYQSSMRPIICPGGPVRRMADVDSVTIHVRMRDGTSEIIPVQKGADAIFFTLSAIDKFAIPYYVRVVGLEDAARLRQRLVNALMNP